MSTIFRTKRTIRYSRKRRSNTYKPAWCAFGRSQGRHRKRVYMKTLRIKHRKKKVYRSADRYGLYDVKKKVEEIVYIVELTEEEYLYVLEKEKRDHGSC